MVRVRRSVVEEKDRYGGYIQRNDTERKPVEVDLNVDPDIELSFSRRPTPVESTERRELPYAPVEYTERYAKKVDAPTRRKRTVPREPEDIMPSIKTRAYMTEQPQEYVEPETTEYKEPKKKAMLSVKSKVMLAVYIAAVVVLAAVVLATGISLSASTARVTALEGLVAERNAVIAEQVADLAALENDATLTGLATELGMQKVNAATEIELLPEVAPVTYEARTNWFDKLCDWLSNLV